MELPLWRERLGFTPPFLKMGYQGHNVAVFKGAGGLAGEFVGLQSELSFGPFYTGAPDYSEALATYQAGFLLSGIVENTAGHFPDLREANIIM